jgi:hypothetical protein
MRYCFLKAFFFVCLYEITFDSHATIPNKREERLNSEA